LFDEEEEVLIIVGGWAMGVGGGGVGRWLFSTSLWVWGDKDFERRGRREVWETISDLGAAGTPERRACM
jgi:hypothetical protein